MSTNLAVRATHTHLDLVRKIKQRNPASINPRFWTPDSVTKHQAWHRQGQIETQALTSIEIEGDAALNQAFQAFVRQPAFFEFLHHCDDWCLRDKDKDWTDFMRLFVAWPEMQMTLALDINRTTIEGGVPVVEYVVRVVEEDGLVLVKDAGVAA